MPRTEGLLQLRLEAVAVTVYDALLEPPFDRPTGAVLECGVCRRALALEGRDQRRERVVAFAAPVVDEIEAGLLVGVRDLVEGADLAGVHDGGVETGLHAFVQKDRVQQLAGGWSE